MLKKVLTILFVICIASLPACARKKQEENIITPMTQLEKRQFQTRTYDSADKALVMKAMLNVLQDEGFIVYNANPLLGFIYGVKDFDTSDKNIDTIDKANKLSAEDYLVKPFMPQALLEILHSILQEKLAL